MKNFANFGLVAIVLYKIFDNLVGKKNIDVKSIIIKTLIAGILIQASRFLVGALVDLSTIATAAVGSFPSQFLHTNNTLNKSIQDRITNTPRKYLIDFSGKKWLTTTDTTENTEWANNRDQILPTHNSVSWPLFYLGFSVFKFQSYMSTAWENGITELTMAFLLRTLLVLFFTISVGLLFIANAIRVAFLRIFIIASPIIVISKVFFDDKWLSWWGKWLGEYLSFGVMIDLIFKPIIFVAGFSMILIFVVSIQKIMNAEIPPTFNGVTIGVTNWASTLAVSDIAHITIKESQLLWGNVSDTAGTQIKEASQTMFVNLILFFLTIFLMWEFVKISVVWSGKWPIWSTMKKLTGTIEWAMKTLPIIPLWWWASITSVFGKNWRWWMMQKNRENMLHGLGLNEQGQFGEYKDGNFTTNQEKFRDFMTPWDPAWKSSDYTNLKRNPKTFLSNSANLAQQRNWGLSIANNSEWTNTLTELLKTNAADILGNGAPSLKDWTSLATYFNDQNDGGKKWLMALYTWLGGQATSGKAYTEKTITRENFSTLTFHNKTE